MESLRSLGIALAVGCTILAAAFSDAQRPAVVGSRPSFGTVEVRLSDNPMASPFWEVTPQGAFHAKSLSLVPSIALAYDIDDLSLVDVPEWVRIQRFDIVATVDPAFGAQWLKVMFRSLLDERFGLLLRREQREQVVYAIVRTPDQPLGPGLRPSDDECVTMGVATRSSRQPRVVAGCGVQVHRDRVRGIAISIDELAESLTKWLNMRVLDRTGLRGMWNVDLALSDSLTSDGVASIAATEQAKRIAGLRAVVEEQLGLQVELRREFVDVYAVIRVQMPIAQ